MLGGIVTAGWLGVTFAAGSNITVGGVFVCTLERGVAGILRNSARSRCGSGSQPS
jgi:hypothetical protein